MMVLVFCLFGFDWMQADSVVLIGVAQWADGGSEG